MGFKNTGYPVTGSMATAYTCPANTVAIVKSLLVANVDGTNTAWFSWQWHDDSGGTDHKGAYQIDVPANQAIDFISSIVVLEAGDYIQCQAEAVSDLEATFAILEQEA